MDRSGLIDDAFNLARYDKQYEVELERISIDFRVKINHESQSQSWKISLQANQNSNK